MSRVGSMAGDARSGFTLMGWQLHNPCPAATCSVLAWWGEGDSMPSAAPPHLTFVPHPPIVAPCCSPHIGTGPLLPWGGHAGCLCNEAGGSCCFKGVAAREPPPGWGGLRIVSRLQGPETAGAYYRPHCPAPGQQGRARADSRTLLQPGQGKCRKLFWRGWAQLGKEPRDTSLGP